MDKFLIDPPDDNITIDNVTVPEEKESVIPTGPPPIETPPIETLPIETPPIETPPIETPPIETPPIETPPIETPPIETPPIETPPIETPPIETPPIETPPIETPPIETPPIEQITIENTSIPQESSNIETGPPPSVIKESIDEPIRLTIPSTPSESEEPVDESLTGEKLLPLENAFVEEPVRFSWTRWILWILILVVFIVLVVYYTIKYTLNESGYLIKKNAKGYKVSLDELKSDTKNWLRGWVEGIRDWNENLGNKTNQFFFRQHVDKGTFKATKYKIPKNLISPTPKV